MYGGQPADIRRNEEGRVVASVVVSIVVVLVVSCTLGHRPLRRTAMVVMASAAFVAPLAALPSSPAAAAARPVVLQAYASPSGAPHTGGTVTAIGKVRGATTCKVAVLGDHGVKVTLPKPSACNDGHYREKVAFGPNPGHSPVVVKLGLLTGSARGVFYVVVAGTTAHPAVLSASASPWELAAKGGWTLVIGHTRDAKTCHLVALGWAHPVLPSQDCSAGTFSEKLWLSPNKNHVAESQAFELVAAGEGTAKGEFFVRLAPAPVPLVTTTTTAATSPATSTPPVTSGLTTGAPPPLFFPPPPTTTVAPTTTTTVPPTTTTTVAPTTTTTVAPPTTTTTLTSTTTTVNPNQYVQQQTSPNWSGYVMTGGQPYTGVSGTFTVSSLVQGTPASDSMDEWVGIDGMYGTAGANDLIQAGIMESMLPCSGTATVGSTYNPDAFYICPWTFFIEDGQMSEGPTPALTLRPGNEVTITIGQVGNSYCPSGTTECWGIEVEDDTTSDVFIVDQPYNGSGSSAEWIVEAPSQPSNSNCTVNPTPPPYECTMPDYTPAVQFTGLGIKPSSYTSLYEAVLVQNGVAVSRPSHLADNYDFSVSYTGGSQAAPEGSGSRLAITSRPLGTPVSVGHSGAAGRPFPTRS